MCGHSVSELPKLNIGSSQLVPLRYFGPGIWSRSCAGIDPDLWVAVAVATIDLGHLRPQK
jgi:hypothetical protein